MVPDIMEETHSILFIPLITIKNLRKLTFSKNLKIGENKVEWLETLGLEKQPGSEFPEFLLSHKHHSPNARQAHNLKIPRVTDRKQHQEKSAFSIQRTRKKVV